MRPNQIQLAFTFLLGMFARTATASNTNQHPMGSDCLLDCENGGECEFVADTLRELQLTAQSSGLIQRCRCPPGWGGVTCEIPTENCRLDTFTCEFSGRPCDQLNNGQWTCHCGIADRVDGGPNADFAGTVCRRGFTEYCNPERYHPDEPLYFCTNGGKCQSDWYAAQEHPGDLNVRKKYMAAGCMCNENFEGEHCEKLVFEPYHLQGLVDPSRLAPDGTVIVDEETSSSSKKKNKGDRNKLTASILGSSAGEVVIVVVFAICIGLAVIVGLLCYRRFRIQRRKRILQDALGKHGLGDYDEEQDETEEHDCGPYGQILSSSAGSSSSSSSNSTLSSLESFRKSSKRARKLGLALVPEERLYDVELDNHHGGSASSSNTSDVTPPTRTTTGSFM